MAVSKKSTFAVNLLAEQTSHYFMENHSYLKGRLTNKPWLFKFGHIVGSFSKQCELVMSRKTTAVYVTNEKN